MRFSEASPRPRKWGNLLRHGLVLALALLATATIWRLAGENLRQQALLDGYEDQFAARLTSLTPGDPLPEVTIVEIDPEGIDQGTELALPEAIEEPTFLFFFTSECPYCLGSLPALKRLKNELTESPVGLVMVSLEIGTSRPGRTRFEIGDRLVAPADPIALRDLGIRAVPALVLANTDGVVLATWTGQMSEHEVPNIVRTAEAAFGLQ